MLIVRVLLLDSVVVVSMSSLLLFSFAGKVYGHRV